MHRYARLLTWLLLALGTALVLVAGCREPEADQAVSRQPLSAAPGGVLTLSDKARAAIGLEVAPVARQPVDVTLGATGWLMVPPGREVTVKAPAAGYVVPPEKNEPALGTALAAGDALGSIQVVLSPQEAAALVAAKEEADILIQQSLVTMQTAQGQLDRLKKTGSAVAGTRIAELEETVARARAAHQEAQEKLPFLPKEPYEHPVGVQPVPIRATASGRVVEVHASPRQFVMQGDPLWTVADWSTLWVRVPVFEGDVSGVAPDRPAWVLLPGVKQPRPAAAVKAPQPAQPGRRTVDLFYAMENPGSGHRPGTPVSVSLPTGKQSEQIVVPRTAVLWDGLGNTWVYLRTGPGEFQRQRIELGPAWAEGFVVERGLAGGQTIVTTGAEALYGEEFKGGTPAEDED